MPLGRYVARLAWLCFTAPILIVIGSFAFGSGDVFWCFLGIIPVMLGWSICAFISLVLAVARALERNWLRCGLSALLPVSAAIAIIISLRSDPLLVERFPAMIGDTLRFATMKPAYDREIASMPNNGRRVKVFDLGGMSFAWDAIIYDETDQLPTNGSDEMSVLCSVTPLWGHYYHGYFGCSIRPISRRLNPTVR